MKKMFVIFFVFGLVFSSVNVQAKTWTNDEEREALCTKLESLLLARGEIPDYLVGDNELKDIFLTWQTHPNVCPDVTSNATIKSFVVAKATKFLVELKTRIVSHPGSEIFFLFKIRGLAKLLGLGDDYCLEQARQIVRAEKLEKTKAVMLKIKNGKSQLGEEEIKSVKMYIGTLITLGVFHPEDFSQTEI